MDEAARQISELTSEYIQLNKDFIKAVHDHRPAAEVETMKDRVRSILFELEYWKQNYNVI